METNEEIISQEDSVYSGFSFSLKELLLWPKELERIYCKTKDLANVEPLYNDAVSKIAVLENKLIVVAFTGNKGVGKSELVNKSAVSQAWLAQYGIPKDQFGKFPLESKLGGESVTPFVHRLKKSDDQFRILLKFVDANQFHIRAPTLMYPDITRHNEPLFQGSLNAWLDFKKQLNSLKDHLSESEQIAVAEVIVEGPWTFPDNFEVLDTPGWGHDEVQDSNNLLCLQQSNVVLTVSARVAGSEEIKKLVLLNTFQNEDTIFGTVYLGRDDIQESDNKVEELLKKHHKRLVKDINTLITDFAVIVPSLDNNNFMDRTTFFSRLARRSRTFFRELFDTNYVTDMFLQMRTAATMALAEEACSAVGVFLMSCNQLVKGITTKNKSYIHNTWKKSMNRSEQRSKDEPDHFIQLAKKISAKVPTDIIDVDVQALSAFSKFVSHQLATVMDSLANQHWTTLDTGFKIYGNLCDKDREDSEESSETADLLENSVKNSWVKRLRESKKTKLVEIIETCRKSIVDIFEAERMDVDLECDSDTEDDDELETAQKIQDIFEEAIRKINDMVKDIKEDVKKTAKTILLEYSSNEKFDDVNGEIQSLIQKINKILSTWSNKPNIPHTTGELPLLQTSHGLLITVPTDKYYEELSSTLYTSNSSKITVKESKISQPWVSGSGFPTVISTEMFCDEKELHVTLPSLLSDYIFQLHKTLRNSIFPIFIAGWLDREENFTKLCFSKLSISKGILFVLVESDQTELFQRKLSELSNLRSCDVCIIKLPGKNMRAPMVLEIAMKIREYYKIPFSWEIDQVLEETREWTRSVIGRTHPCTVERTLFGMQQTVWELENYVMKKVLEFIETNRRKLIHSPLLSNKEKEDVDADIEMFRSTKPTMDQLFNFLNLVKDSSLNEPMKKDLNKFRSLALVIAMPRQFHVSEVLTNYPNLVKILKTSDKRVKIRKLQGVLLYNTSAMEGFSYLNLSHSLSKEMKPNSEPRTLQSFTDDLIDRRVSLVRKMKDKQRKFMLNRIWSFNLKQLEKQNKRKTKNKDSSKKKTKSKKMKVDDDDDN